MLFVDQPVDLRVVKANALGSSRSIILIVNRIRIDGRPANVVKRDFAAVDAVRPPENGKFLRDQLGLYAGPG
jgi:hypothetical protein